MDSDAHNHLRAVRESLSADLAQAQSMQAYYNHEAQKQLDLIRSVVVSRSSSPNAVSEQIDHLITLERGAQLVPSIVAALQESIASVDSQLLAL